MRPASSQLTFSWAALAGVCDASRAVPYGDFRPAAAPSHGELASDGVGPGVLRPLPPFEADGVAVACDYCDGAQLLFSALTTFTLALTVRYFRGGARPTATLLMRPSCALRRQSYSLRAHCPFSRLLTTMPRKEEDEMIFCVSFELALSNEYSYSRA